MPKPKHWSMETNIEAVRRLSLTQWVKQYPSVLLYKDVCTSKLYAKVF